MTTFDEVPVEPFPGLIVEKRFRKMRLPRFVVCLTLGRAEVSALAMECGQTEANQLHSLTVTKSRRKCGAINVRPLHKHPKHP
jgi:hypothetical protein